MEELNVSETIILKVSKKIKLNEGAKYEQCEIFFMKKKTIGIKKERKKDAEILNLIHEQQTLPFRINKTCLITPELLKTVYKINKT